MQRDATLSHPAVILIAFVYADALIPNFWCEFRHLPHNRRFQVALATDLEDSTIEPPLCAVGLADDEDSFGLAMAYVCSVVFSVSTGEYDADIRTQVWDTSVVVLISWIDLVKFEELDFWI